MSRRKLSDFSLRDLTSDLLAHFYSIKIAVDVTIPGVVLPPHLMAPRRPLILQYGLDLPVPINDLNITDDGIGATLSFGRELHRTWIPWMAIAQIVPFDSLDLPIPPEEIERVLLGTPPQGMLTPAPARAIVDASVAEAERLRRRAHLQSVPADVGADDGPRVVYSADAETIEGAVHVRPTLRVVN